MIEVAARSQDEQARENAWGEDTPDNFDTLRSRAGLSEIARYAQGIGPWIEHVLQDSSSNNPSPLVTNAHVLGLLVHPYTLRQDDLPTGTESCESLMASTPPFPKATAHVLSDIF